MGRVSPCDEISEDNFDNADDAMVPSLTLEDFLPWPPELQFWPQSLRAHSLVLRQHARVEVG
jgi:hypothetical protein